MAKKKTITKVQLQQLSLKLVDTTANVYRMVEQMFGLKVDDTIFDQLLGQYQLFHCENCNMWLHTESESSDIASWCEECVDTQLCDEEN